MDYDGHVPQDEHSIEQAQSQADDHSSNIPD
jgi:hypothetical protein